MALVTYNNKTVGIIQPVNEGTLVNVGALEGNPNANPSLVLPNDHPAYSAIFALLMASAVNKKSLDQIFVDNSTSPYMTLTGVKFVF